MRPLGAEVIAVSYDDEKKEPQIYKVDPSGHYVGYKACASGVKEAETTSQLEKAMKDMKDKPEQWKSMDRDTTIQTAISILQNVKGYNSENNLIGVVCKLQAN